MLHHSYYCVHRKVSIRMRVEKCAKLWSTLTLSNFGVKQVKYSIAGLYTNYLNLSGWLDTVWINCLTNRRVGFCILLKSVFGYPLQAGHWGNGACQLKVIAWEPKGKCKRGRKETLRRTEQKEKWTEWDGMTELEWCKKCCHRLIEMEAFTPLKEDTY